MGKLKKPRDYSFFPMKAISKLSLQKVNETIIFNFTVQNFKFEIGA